MRETSIGDGIIIASIMFGVLGFVGLAVVDNYHVNKLKAGVFNNCVTAGHDLDSCADLLNESEGE